MILKDVLLILIPLITGIIGSYLTYYFTQKNKKVENSIKFKEERYKELLVSLQGFVGRTANSESKKKFLNEFYKSWLYCSDEVIESVYGMLALIMNKPTADIEIDTALGREAVGKIVLAMRRDLLGKTNKKPIDFLFIDVYE